MIIRKGPEEIERIARAGELASATISHVGEYLEPGISTEALDRIADRFITSHGGTPTSKGYKGFPAAICISPNEIIVHGIPGPYELERGDIVTIDIGVTLDGAIADTAYTFPIGPVVPEVQHLLDTAQEALAAGVAHARPDNRIGDISHAIQEVVEVEGFAVVRQLVGHGVGRRYHEDPHVPNFGSAGKGPRLSTGMTIAIEPMITMGSPAVTMHADGWTIATIDRSLAAHFEHTVAITPDGPRILTPRVGIAKEHAGLLQFTTRGAPA